MRELLKVQEKVHRAGRPSTTLKTIRRVSVIIWRRRVNTAKVSRCCAGPTMVWSEHLGQPTADTLFYRRQLVLILAVQDKDVEAEAEAREIVKIRDKSIGAERQGWPRDILWRRLG